MGGKKKEAFSEKGLSSKEAQRRLEESGPNELAKPPGLSGLKIFLSQFKSPLVYVLLFAGLVTLFLRDFTDSIVIFAAVFLNTILGFYQERKAQKSLIALRSLLAPKAKVIRDGKREIIDAREVVPGDLVILEIGERVPADGVLLKATDLSLNEAILTGESMPVERRGKDEIYMGTTVATGIAKMRVAKTGMETKMGKIGERVEEIKERDHSFYFSLWRIFRLHAFGDVHHQCGHRGGSDS
jgi:Ca2+-transporting ATPase